MTDPSRSTVFLYDSCDRLVAKTDYLFEAINSTGWRRFGEVAAKARSGEMSKEEFTKEMRRIEFGAVKRGRDVLRGIKFSTDQKEKSYYYRRLAQCPEDFDEFVSYQKKVSPQRDVTAEWSARYDMLRGESRKYEK